MIERKFFLQEHSVIKVSLIEAMKTREKEIEIMNFKRRKNPNESDSLKRHNDLYIQNRLNDLSWMQNALHALQ
jgi:hypothetical protein